MIFVDMREIREAYLVKEICVQVKCRIGHHDSMTRYFRIMIKFPVRTRRTERDFENVLSDKKCTPS